MQRITEPRFKAHESTSSVRSTNSARRRTSTASPRVGRRGAFGLGLLVMLWAGWHGALFVVPADYQQGDSFRILYIHVPSARG